MLLAFVPFDSSVWKTGCLLTYNLPLAQGIAAQLAGRSGPREARRSDDASGGSFGGGGGGGRFARRGSESAAAERRSAQERLYSMDLDRVLAGERQLLWGCVLRA